MIIKYFWACDINNHTGEGNLGRLYLSKIKGRKKILTCETYFKNKIIKKFFNYKYISPYVGLLVCWYCYFANKSITYINYLPLWNFLIFLLLPPDTKIGPITGGAFYSKNNQYIIRKYIFPILYKLSEKIIINRYENILFSTSLLKKHLSQKTIKNSKFDFILNYLKIVKTKRKNIDFVIYYRDHKNKKNLYNFSFIKKIAKKKFKICIVGDYLDIKGVQNMGYIPNGKLIDMLARTKFTVSSNENVFSLFNIECINNNVKIILNKKYIPKNKFLIKKFIPLKNNQLFVR